MAEICNNCFSSTSVNRRKIIFARYSTQRGDLLLSRFHVRFRNGGGNGKNVTVNGMTRIFCNIKLGVVGPHVESLSLHCDVEREDYLNILEI